MKPRKPTKDLIMRNYKKFALPKAAFVCGLAVAAGLILSACTTSGDSGDSKDNKLAAAGFTMKPANTAKRAAMLKHLPPNQFVKTVHGDNVSYAYADPAGCDCLYVGSQKAYGRYQRALQNERIANKNLWAAQTYSDDLWDWNEWGSDIADFNGPFGPGFNVY